MNCVLTQHARESIARREIAMEWVEAVIAHPDAVEGDPVDPSLEHRLGRIGAYGNRVLRVILNAEEALIRVVTAFFDRRMKGKI